MTVIHWLWGARQEDSRAVGVNGDQDSNGNPFSGAAYVFVRDGASWTQQAYLKASNSQHSNGFGDSVAISGDGSTIAVSDEGEASSATGINGDQDDDTAPFSGAVYIFVRDGALWSQQAYIKPSNNDPDHRFEFGKSLSLSSDGDTLVASGHKEFSDARGVNGDQSSRAAPGSGAVYVFGRVSTTWTQQAYIKASNTEVGDLFGYTVSLSGDGDTLAVGAFGESSNATGVNGDQTDNSASYSGAVYVFGKSGAIWSQQAYLKASNTDGHDSFGYAMTFSENGDRLFVGAPEEESSAIGIDGDQSINSSYGGAVYMFARDGSAWSQQSYIKASNETAYFGSAIAYSDLNQTLAVAAPGDRSNATGINGDQDDTSAAISGAVHLY